MSLNVTSNIGIIGYNNTNTSKNGFVAVAGTSEYSAYSTDGINWTDFKISDSMNIYWSSVSYGNGIYVAFPSASKYYAYSYDGINWTETQFTNVSITGKVCFGNGKFVVCSATSNAASNTFAIYSSTDGINWTTATDISQLSYEFLEKYTEFFIDGDVTKLYPCYGNGKFVAVTDNYSLSIYSTDGLTWTRVVINESTNIKFRAICYGNGKFVAVAYNTNYFAYSSDGITWTTGRLPSSRDWYSVCYGNGKFVTIAYNSNAFAYSTDGINWTAGTISSTSRKWYSVCYGDGKFIAIASDTNYYAYSTDGINWTEGTISSTSRSWDSVCSGVINASINTPEKAFNLSQPENASTTEFEDKVILDSIVHHDSPMYLLINRKATDNNFYIHSPVLGDITLTDSDRKIYPVDSNMNRNCIGGKLHPLGDGYVAYSVYSNNMDATSKFSDSDTGSLELITGIIKANPYLGYYKSVNGTNFYGSENDEDGFMKPYKEMYGMFIILAHNNGGISSSDKFTYSTDGMNWTECTISSTNRLWSSVCYGNGKFVTIAYKSNYFAYSTDGINWTEGTISSTNRYWNSVCYGNGKFVAVAYNSNYFAYSTDGINWTEGTISSTSRNWESVCYGNGKFVAVAWNSYFAYSTDGINWNEGTISSTSRYWHSVCYGNDKFVAIADSTNYFAYSTDGINWTEGTISDTSRYWQSVCYGNGKFVAVAYNSNYFAYSTDGINWTESTISNTGRQWGSVCYGKDKFIVISTKDNQSNIYAYSTDGMNWTESTISKYIGGSIYYFSITNIEFSNNHTGISTDVTDVNGISSMTTYTEQYTEDVYYIHYAWVDRASSSLVRYNILTRKIDTSSGIPVISNVASYTTTFSIGTVAHPSFHKDKNGIHCAFYHGNTTYTKYYKLTRSGTDDSTWSWGVDSNTYITNENISLMVNKNENNLQSSVAQSARRMYMVNNSDKLVEFKKTQTF